jgi:enterobacterial common antigen flippase
MSYGTLVPAARHENTLIGLRGRSTAWLGTAFAQFAMLGLGVVSGIASGRLLGPQGRGELAAITVWPMTLSFLVSLGTNQAIVFYTGKKRYSVSEVWTASGVIALVQSVLVLCMGAALIPFLLHKYPSEDRSLSLVFLLAMPAMIIGGYPGNILQGKGDLVRFNKLRMISPAIYASGLFALLLMRLSSLPAVLWMQVGGYAVAVAFAVWVVYRLERPKFVWVRAAATDLLKYGSKTHLASVTSFLNQRVDQLVLSLLIPAQELGLYAVAVTLAMSVTFLPAAAGIVTFSHGSNQSEETLRNTIRRSFRLSLLWLLVGCSALFVLTPVLINLALGPRFANSVFACRLLLPGIVALGLNQVLYGGANAIGQPLLPSYAEAAGLAATIIGLTIFAPRFGFIGAAIVSSIAYTISLGVMLVLASRRMKIHLGYLLFPRQKL